MIISEEYLAYFLSFIFSFTITILSIIWLIPHLRSKGFVGKDMKKSDKPEIPEMGGIGVIIGFFIGIYLQILIFYLFAVEQIIDDFLIASSLVLLGLGFVGLLDDLIDLRQRTKAVLPFLFALPLGVFISDTMFLPFIGEINFGVFMLILVPIGVTCAANATNMLEGFNGLGTGLAMIICSTLILIAILNGNSKGIFILAPLLGSLIAFYYFNSYPSQIFPGDTLTLFMGGAISCATIISNLKLEGMILMIPMIIEFFLKLRGKFKAECFGTVNQSGVLTYTGKIESLTHFVMVNFEVNEKKLVYYFFGAEIIIAAIVVYFTKIGFFVS